MKYTRKFIYRYFKKHIHFPKAIMLICGIASLAITAVGLIHPYLYKILVDDVMVGGKISLLYYVITAMIGAYLIKLALNGINTYARVKLTYDTELETKKLLMDRFLSGSLSNAKSQNIGTQSNILEQDSKIVASFLLNHVISVVTAFIMVAVYMALMIKINVYLGLISVITLPVTIWVSHILGKKYNAVNKEGYEVKSSTKTHLFDTIQKWREIKSNILEERFYHDYNDRLEPERKLNSKWMYYYALKGFFYEVKTRFVLKVLMYFVGGLFVLSKHITIGELLMFISYVEGMDLVLDTIMRSKTDFMGEAADFERLIKVLDNADEKRGISCPSVYEIKFKNADFGYEGMAYKVLEDACCEFKQGKKYLIIGKSGEGKSTIIKLLLGINRLQNGEVLFNNISAEEIDAHDLLQNIGVVMQESMFFNLSIRENLGLIAPESTEEEMLSALKSACLLDFVLSLPQRLDTVIGERGIKLSGGQKQRLALARLFLRNPQIIILDEATSALDTLVENQIFDNINSFFKDRTMLVISHKPIVNYLNDQTYLVANKGIVPINS